MSGVSQHAFDYKASLHKIYKPDVVAMGSSRALSFRKQFFNSSFVNWGGSFGSIPEIRGAVQFILAQKNRPKIFIIAVDIWWFNKVQNMDTITVRDFPHFPSAPSFSLYTQSLNVMWENKDRLNLIFQNQNLGFAAKLGGNGFDAYGSYYIYSNGRDPYSDPQVKARTINRIKNGDFPYFFGDTANDPVIPAFLSIDALLKKNEIHTILIFPPFPSTTLKLLRSSGKHQYFQDVMQKFSQSGVRYYDYTDAEAAFGVNLDKEFGDDIHSCDVMYARIVRDVAKQDPYFAKFVDLDFVNSFIEKYKGDAISGN